MARKFVRTKIRLYGYDPVMDTRYLAYPVGADVPLAEYERLIRLNAAAAVRHVETKDVLPQDVQTKAAELEVITVAEPDDPKPKPEPPAFHTMLRAQLLVEAKARGLDVHTRMSKAELLKTLEDATS